MNIKEQVLSIEQVQELQELGFDVKEHSSMYYLPYYNSSSYKIDGYILDTIEKNDSFNSIPTLSIGDIIDILPIEIHKYVLVMNKKYIAYDDGANTLFYAYRRRFIDSLFDCLVWCIKEKYIKL